MIQHVETQFFHTNEMMHSKAKENPRSKKNSHNKSSPAAADKEETSKSFSTPDHQPNVTKAKGNARDMAGDGGEGVQKANE